MKKIIFTLALVCLSSVAFAKKPAGKPTPQNHSCILKEAVVEKTKKECLKAGGKWEKNAPADSKPADPKAPADAAKPAPAPTPAAPTPAPATK